MNRFQVVAGILRAGDGRVLLAERLRDGPFAGLWEFPGGKLAAGESAGAALRRELAEELGIAVDEAAPFMALQHEYPDRVVDLEFFLVSAWCGEPEGREGQRLRWVLPVDIDAAELLPADAPVVRKLRGHCE
jgi:8-oxo-dGTP diphosphatase